MSIFSAKKGRGATFKIDGKSFTGNEINISKDGKVVVDGVEQEGNLVGNVTVNITGDVGEIETVNGNVTCSGAVNKISTVNGNVNCEKVAGNVNSVNGRVNVRSVSGGLKV